MARDLIVLHNYTGGHNKLYVVRVDQLNPSEFRVVASYGSAKDTFLKDHIKGTRAAEYQAYQLAADTADAKRRGGYVDIEGPHYNCHPSMRVTLGEASAKVDVSRLVSQHAKVVAAKALASIAPQVVKTEGGGPARRNRSVIV